jgi:hypothetical protein
MERRPGSRLYAIGKLRVQHSTLRSPSNKGPVSGGASAGRRGHRNFETGWPDLKIFSLDLPERQTAGVVTLGAAGLQRLVPGRPQAGTAAVDVAETR